MEFNNLLESFGLKLLWVPISLVINLFAVKISNYFSGVARNFFWKRKYPSLQARPWYNELSEIKKKAKIVVIDDERTFPTQLFSDSGYNIVEWEKVRDYEKLEKGEFDIIILDIMGVALEISKDDGLGVLESLKTTNPSQIIVAFSQHSYDLGKSKFWAMSDDKIAKPSDFLSIKSVVDNLLINVFRPERYVQQMHKVLRDAGIEQRIINKIDGVIIESIETNNEINLRKIEEFIGNNDAARIKVKRYASTIKRMY
jgi:CheY-like chemotaxis protein